jgi:hypothetical protein
MHITFDWCFYDEGIWTLDPRDEPEIDEDKEWPTPLTEWVEEEFMGFEVCPYCRTGLETSSYLDEEDGSCEVIRGDEPDVAQLWTCPYCGYWQWYSIFENRGLHGSAAMSILSAFDPVVPENCWTELAQHLRRNESLWHSISPYGMERLVAEIFRSNYSHAEVIHVGKPADLGIDVIFIESGGNKWLIQVKRREKSGAVEGFETLQKLLGTLVLEGQFRGVIASNASHFSYQAKREAKRASLRGFTIELLDRGKLNRMLGPMLPIQPWRAFVEEAHFPDEVEQRFINMPSAHRRD